MNMIPMMPEAFAVPDETKLGALVERLVVELGRPEFVGVDPRASLDLVAVLENWSQEQAADVLQLIIGIAVVVGVAAIVPALLLGPGDQS